MKQHRLPMGAKLFLICAGIVFDIIKLGFDALFGIGIILDPLFITPIAGLVFWIVLRHNDVPMFTGERSWAGWSNIVFSLTPILDALPDWTAYAIYLSVVHG